MKIDYHKDFRKDFHKLQPKQQAQFAKRLKLFLEEPSHPQLKLHQLSGEYRGTCSFNVAGDLRAHFQYSTAKHILFTRIGTHAQLYE